MNKKIIHCDCDCFFAAIEIRDDPSLKGLPVAVGGSEDRRGVIATCNYEARKYGVHSALASARARKLCPDLIIISPDMEKYRSASRAMHLIFKDYTELIEPLSLDEAFLDVSSSRACAGSATLIAQAIRQRVRKELGITLSAGVAPNKFLAKIASDWNKPDGQFVITPAQVPAFIARLPVSKLHGVGKVTANKMHNMGIHNCKDLQAYDKSELIQLFGSFGDTLYSLSRGLDEREVINQHQRKSISVEHTFDRDLPSIEQCLSELPLLMEKLEKRLGNNRKQNLIAKLFVKLRFNDFISTTVEQGAGELNLDIFKHLCETGFARRNKPVRLLGLGIRLRTMKQLQQIPFVFYQ